MDLKKAYYYIICLTALFVLAWGVVDFSGATIGLITNRTPSASIELSSQGPSDKESTYLETYYQKKMFYDRLWDSLARIVVAGAIFACCRPKVDRV